MGNGTQMAFKKATKTEARLRCALIGPSGSGKTYTALAIATRLCTRVALIDSERGSASKYADIFDFDVLELDSFEPSTYADAIKLAEREGYDGLVIDSLSHAWMGKGGALDQVDRAAKRSQSSNSFAAWREVTPMHNALVDTILGSRAHVVATMRSKTEYVIEEDSRGKKVPRKIGMAPVQRDGVEYEFDVIADMDLANNFVVSKSRCPRLNGAVFNKPGEELVEILRAWLSDGTAPPPRAEFFDGLPHVNVIDGDQATELTETAQVAGLSLSRLCAAYKIGAIEDLPAAEYEAARDRIARFAAQVAARQAQSARAEADE